MEPLGTTYAKVVDDLSEKIFIPALISVIGLILVPIILLIIMETSIRLFRGRHIGPEIGVVLMPLGFAGLFPEQFKELGIPYSQVTGLAILAWSFMLVKRRRFFYGHFWGDD